MDDDVPRGAADGHPTTPPIVVILGGGIGAGKSAVGELLADRGFAVLVADRVGHEVLAADEDARREVADRWPDVVVGGVVDRGRLAARVFGDRNELDALEAIVHPRVLHRVGTWLEETTGDAVIEIPLLHFAQRVADELARPVVRMAVVADAPTRIARAVTRGADAADVEARIAMQATDDRWREWADVVVDNGGAWSATEAAVVATIEDLRIHA